MIGKIPIITGNTSAHFANLEAQPATNAAIEPAQKNQSKTRGEIIDILYAQMQKEKKESLIKDDLVQYVRERKKKVVPVNIPCDISSLSENDKKVLAKLVEASEIINQIYLRQMYERNEEIRKILSESTDPRAKELLDWLDFNGAPFDAGDSLKPFLPVGKAPDGANFYPADMKKEEFEKWITDHPKDKAAFTSSFTVIRRDKNDPKKLVAIPYHVEYADLLAKLAQTLKDAAKISDNPSVKKYLNLRADAILNDNYSESDMAWIDLKDTPLEIVIGPYETYDDNISGSKASYESYLTIVDKGESEKLKIYISKLKDIQDALPIDEKNRYTFTKKLDKCPIKVVDVFETTGDARAGYTPRAFNLPNDEAIRNNYGTKNVLLKNMIEAKHTLITVPIASQLLDPGQTKFLTFESAFNDILFHEIGHGMGPGQIIKNGVKMSVSEALKELYTTIEESRADVTSPFIENILIKSGDLTEDKCSAIVAYVTYLLCAGRNGEDEPHAKGAIMQLNYLMDPKQGAIEYNMATNRYKINFEKFLPALNSLLKKLNTIEAEGDYEGAKVLLEAYGKMPGHLKERAEMLKKDPTIPEEIIPMYDTEIK